MPIDEPPAAEMPAGGSLDVVGLGFLGIGQITPEALSCIQSADKLFFLGADAISREWLKIQNSTLESLYDAYAAGRNRLDSYHEMVRRILSPLSSGENVCVAFYGHPGVFVYPSHEAIRQARANGYIATMYPAISAEDCLFADLEIDPVESGCASYEATDFLVRPRRIDTHASLILWQAGGIGVTTYENGLEWNPDGVRFLAERLLELYAPDHDVIIYEAAVLPICNPRIDRIALKELPLARVSVYSTLYIPASPAPPMTAGDIRALGL